MIADTVKSYIGNTIVNDTLITKINQVQMAPESPEPTVRGRKAVL